MQTQKNTHQLPGIADVVGVFTDIPKSVGVPGQGRVERDADDLTPQRKAGRSTAVKKTHQDVCRVGVGGPGWGLPEDVLPDSRESWDVLVVDDVGVQGGLCHQVRPGERGVHQGVTWETNASFLRN